MGRGRPGCTIRAESSAEGTNRLHVRFDDDHQLIGQ
jgi:hypothetical protein